jgi:hypothetical protein
MALTVTVRQGGTAGAEEYDYTSQINFWSSAAKLSGGGMWDTGGATQGQFAITDDSNVIGGTAGPYLGAHDQIKFIENASGCDYWLSIGRIDRIEWSGADKPWGSSRTGVVTFDDCNLDLKGLALTEDWTRSAETDYARLVALQAYTLAGTASTRSDVSGVHTYRPSTDIVVSDSHLCKNANTVTMPAVTYPAGTDIMAIVADCATTAGKNYGVVIHNAPVTSLTTMSWSGIPTSATAPPHWPFCGSVQKIIGFNAAASATATVESTYAEHGESSTPECSNVVVSGTAASRGLLFIVNGNYGDGSVLDGAKYIPDNVAPFTSVPMTKIGSSIQLASTADDSASVKGVQIAAFYLADPAASNATHKGSVYLDATNAYWSAAVYVLSGVDGVADSADITSDGTTTISGDCAGNLIIDGVAYRDTWGVDSYPTAGASQTIDQQIGEGGVSYGIMDPVLNTSHAAGSANDSCSHMCLQYIIPTDTTTNVSTVSFSDVLSELDTTSTSAPVLPPIWDQGPALIGDGSQAVGGIVSTYTNGTANAAIVSIDSSWPNLHDYWTVGVNDSQSKTTAQATLRAAAVRSALRPQKQTHQVSAKFRSTQTHLLTAGMLVTLRSARGNGGVYYGGTASLRVASVKWEPVAPEDSATGTPGWYYAHMELDRAVKLVPEAVGSFGSVNSNTAVTAAGSAIAQEILTTKGDLITFGTAVARLGVGTDGYILTANSTATYGLDWEVAAGGASNGTPALTLGTANAAGTASYSVGIDSTIAAFSTAVPVVQTYSDSAASGTAGYAARLDHVHGMPAAGTGVAPLTTKGDIFTYGTADARLPVGTDGYVLTANSTATYGVDWEASTGGATGVPWIDSSTNPDKPAASPNTEDDEFDGSSLDVKWTHVGTGTLSFAGSKLVVAHSSSSGTELFYQAFAPGAGVAFTITAHVTGYSYYEATDYVGIQVLDSTPAAICGIDVRYTAGNFRFNKDVPGPTSGRDLPSRPWSGGFYIRISRDASNNYTGALSLDGVSWTDYGVTWGSSSTTVANIGFRFGQTSTTSWKVGSIDWFRRT